MALPKKSRSTEAAAPISPKQEKVLIKALERSRMRVVLMGESPLIVHQWEQKAKLEMLRKQLRIPAVREPKDPYQQFLGSMYRFEDGGYGFPATGVKEALATATTDLEGIFKTQIYRNIFITGRRGFSIGAFADIKTPHELLELYSPNPPQMREDMVRLSGIGRTADIRYRAEFWPWAVRFNLMFLPDFIDSQSILNLLSQAGFTIGLGEWRQEKGGNSGAFHVASAEDVKEVEKWIKDGHKEPERIDVKAWIHQMEADAAADRKKKRSADANVVEDEEVTA
jgi:hypothetical protein